MTGAGQGTCQNQGKKCPYLRLSHLVNFFFFFDKVNIWMSVCKI